MKEVLVEDNFGQGMMAALMEPVLRRHYVEPGDDQYPKGWKCFIDTRRMSQQKEVRIIESLEPVMNSHRLVVDQTVASNMEFQQQLTRITRQRNCLAHEDELESLAMCVAEWRDVLYQDPVVSADRLAEADLDKALQEHYLQHESASPGWFTHV